MVNIDKKGEVDLSIFAVTPYAGVWIETAPKRDKFLSIPVTPYAGVWIETLPALHIFQIKRVTPYAGVWIETATSPSMLLMASSLPTRECGLKLSHEISYCQACIVTPDAGVWIETR